MKVAIMQPYFFPYIGYWQLIRAVDKYVVYDDVSYIKGGWINRNNILLNGKRHLITLPLDNPSSFRNINEIYITSNKRVREKLLRTIESAYKKAPFFDVIYPMIADLILNAMTISELNFNSILKICDYLGIATEIILSSYLNKDNSLKGQAKVIHISKILGANTYINAIGGKKLYSFKAFKEVGLDLQFLEMGDICYKQYDNEFVQGLSVIDALMFNDKGKIHDFLKIRKISGGGRRKRILTYHIFFNLNFCTERIAV